MVFPHRIALALATAVAVPSLASAQLASRPAAEWVEVLDSEARIAGLKVNEVVAALDLDAGDVVADLGAGSGPFVVPFARAVTPTGKVYAVDIDRGFFSFIEGKAQAAGVANVQTVLGEFTDPRLPAADVDVAFLHDVLHHIADRRAYLATLVKYLQPGARIAIVDYHPDQSPHRDDASLQVSKEQAASWLAEAGFKPVREVPLFTEKWFVVYAR